MLQRWHSGDGCDLVSTLCKYDLRKGDLFVLSWAVLNAAFCMTCSLLMLVEDARGNHIEEAYSRACLMTAL